MFHVVSALEALHKHVVDVYLYGVFSLLFEDLVDHSLESYSRILQSERHHLVALDSSVGDECRLVLIWWIHFDLIVLGVGVHKGE